MRKPINGILLLDKPINMTSNAALQRVKRIFNAKKAGHTGSLDPIATGMLPICFGEATKFSQYLLDSDKSYYVVAKLGEQTTTGDIEGEILHKRDIVDVSEEKIKSVLRTFLGKTTQIPPMFSAIKHQGKPLYELARRGISIERKPRNITIFSAEFIALSADTFSFNVHCSKGTYIRTLVEDISNILGCGGHVIELRRMQVSPYTADKMYTLNQIENLANNANLGDLNLSLLPIETSVSILPIVKLTTSAIFYLRMGQAVRSPFAIESPLVRLMSEDSTFIGVGEMMPDGRVKPHRLVADEKHNQ